MLDQWKGRVIRLGVSMTFKTDTPPWEVFIRFGTSKILFFRMERAPMMRSYIGCSETRKRMSRNTLVLLLWYHVK